MYQEMGGHIIRELNWKYINKFLKYYINFNKLYKIKINSLFFLTIVVPYL